LKLSWKKQLCNPTITHLQMKSPFLSLQRGLPTSSQQREAIVR
jgi:hypothetical protein